MKNILIVILISSFIFILLILKLIIHLRERRHRLIFVVDYSNNLNEPQVRVGFKIFHIQNTIYAKFPAYNKLRKVRFDGKNYFLK